MERPIVRLVLLYRQKRYGYTFRKIRLTKGKCAIVDPDDFEELNQYSWYAVKAGHTFYAVRSICTDNKKKTTVKMHRQIMRPDKELFIDHINHNGLDNRRDNLRCATPAQNSCNRRNRNNCGGSRYRGVTRNEYHNKWRAVIRHNGKKEHLGYFADEIEAARAYDAAAKHYHGEFAVLNFE
jgi:hypothetical protein